MGNGLTRMTMAFYRLSRRIHLSGRPGLARAVAAFARVLTSIEISPEAVIDPSLGIHHGQGIVIGPNVVIGPGCLLCQNVTLGAKHGGVPTLGERVTVYPGAKIIGAVHIGDRASVGANAVVFRDVAAGDVVAGVPARVIGSVFSS